ncbi:MAG TPA: hypothetical protein DDZ88_15610 [Verrucomicrobiales bacterium]|nr:hypothetical protein [Verrucomicrobiales bacterium]
MVQEVDGKQAGRLALNGGLVPTEATNGGIARGGSAEPHGEGVAGHFPLKWVAHHIVGARERLFPADGTDTEVAIVKKRCPPKLPWTDKLPG